MPGPGPDCTRCPPNHLRNACRASSLDSGPMRTVLLALMLLAVCCIVVVIWLYQYTHTSFP